MRAVIFAGGVGTRLWPLSRKKSPKQFEKIVGDKSTLQLAAERLQPDFSWEDIYVATGKDFVGLVREQLPQLPKGNVIGEPEMRDVGPAVGLMAAVLKEESPDEPVAILWSDHLVKREDLFRKILLTAGEVIEEKKENIVIVGQKPRFPSENLGWIEYGKKISEKDGITFYSLVGYKYRPDADTAKKYFERGHHAWNLGYFVTTPAFLLQQYEKYAPKIYKGVARIAESWGSKKFEKELSGIYPTLDKINFDNAILEKMDRRHALVVSENIEWSDVGAWEALKEALADSKDKNVTQGRVLLHETEDSLVYNYTDQMLVCIDLEDMLVVNTDDVVLVCKKSSVPKIKKFVESLSGTENEHLT